jgi:hypothetical protein
MTAPFASMRGVIANIMRTSLKDMEVMQHQKENVTRV